MTALRASNAEAAGEFVYVRPGSMLVAGLRGKIGHPDPDAAFGLGRPQIGDLALPDHPGEVTGMMRLAMVGLACWALAGAVSAGRLLSTLHSSTRFLDAVAPSLDSALAMRRELGTGLATLETMATARATRSRRLAMIGALTGALGDSVFLVVLRVGPDGTVRLAGYAPSAARALADLERVRQLREAKLEGPVTREAVVGRKPLDRFAIVAQLVGAP